MKLGEGFEENFIEICFIITENFCLKFNNTNKKK